MTQQGERESRMASKKLFTNLAQASIDKFGPKNHPLGTFSSLVFCANSITVSILIWSRVGNDCFYPSHPSHVLKKSFNCRTFCFVCDREKKKEQQTSSLANNEWESKKKQKNTEKRRNRRKALIEDNYVMCHVFAILKFGQNVIWSEGWENDRLRKGV